MTLTGRSADESPLIAAADYAAMPDDPDDPQGPPVSPFTLLRVAFGMLLGVDDFRTVIGYARGKHLLHQAWLHGPGVVWGYGLTLNNTELKVRSGLAVDGLGRDLLLQGDSCIDVADWFHKSDPPVTVVHSDAGDERHVVADVVVQAGYRLTDPVPALADPADPARRTDDYARFREDVVLGLVPRVPGDAPSGAFHRVRVLFGLERVGDNDPAGEEAAAQAREVAGLPSADRPAGLLAALRRLATLDVMDRVPVSGEGASQALPSPSAGTGVVLGRLMIRLDANGVTAIEWPPDWSPRTDLLPTALIQELTCAVAPDITGTPDEGDGGDGQPGPRVLLESVHWESDRQLSVRVDASLRRLSVAEDAVQLSSVSPEGQWVREGLQAVEYQDADAGGVITLRLQDPPTHELVRLVVRGTGPTPVIGVDGMPLAGVSGAPAAGVGGRDAVLHIRRSDDEQQ